MLKEEHMVGGGDAEQDILDQHIFRMKIYWKCFNTCLYFLGADVNVGVFHFVAYIKPAIARSLSEE